MSKDGSTRQRLKKDCMVPSRWQNARASPQREFVVPERAPAPSAHSSSSLAMCLHGTSFTTSVCAIPGSKSQESQPAAESCGACFRREQARRNLAEDLVVVSGYRSLHMNTSALYACFLRQPLELTLKEEFQLLRCQDGNGNGRGLARIGLDPHAVWGFGLLCFRSHATPLFLERRKVAGKIDSILARPDVPCANRWVRVAGFPIPSVFDGRRRQAGRSTSGRPSEIRVRQQDGQTAQPLVRAVASSLCARYRVERHLD